MKCYLVGISFKGLILRTKCVLITYEFNKCFMYLKIAFASRDSGMISIVVKVMKCS